MNQADFQVKSHEITYLFIDLNGEKIIDKITKIVYNNIRCVN